MYETEAEFGSEDHEKFMDFWGFGLIIIFLGVIAILYYLRYV